LEPPTLPYLCWLSHEDLPYIIGKRVQGPTVGQGQKRNERGKKQRDRCSMSSGGFEPGHMVSYMGGLHEDLYVSDHERYPSAPRSEFKI
jgi:hypothetical protein